MSRPIKKQLTFVTLLLVTLTLSGCGGESDSDFLNFVNKVFPDGGGASTPAPSTSNEYADYKKVTNAMALIEGSDTSAISIGILDDGFQVGLVSHVELDDRVVVQQNYTDPTQINNDIVNGVYGDQGVAWKWANHGTGVAGIALGKNSGVAPQAQAYTSMNRSLTDFFDADNYFQSFSKELTGRLDDSEEDAGTCIQHIYLDESNSRGRWFPWCVNYTNYSFKKMKEASTLAGFNMPVVNLSSSIPFGHFQTGVDLSFNQAKWDDDSYKAEWDQVNLTEFKKLYFYDYNVSYEYMRSLLSTGDLVMVLAAGNDFGATLTQRMVVEWQELQRSSTNPMAQTIVNVFFDHDIDLDADGSIDDKDRGITKGLLFVGALDSTGVIALYSNIPGSSPEVQARFLVAPGDLSVATPSLGESGYSLITGTSNAAPIVSGAIALLKTEHPTKSAREIANAILKTASKNIPEYSIETHGQGLLDVAAADEFLKVN